MAKQVITTPAEPARTNNLYMTINTVDVAGKAVGYRLVDLYHFGTRNWLSNHHWWAMHQGHEVIICPASQDEVNSYLAEKAKELQDKFNGPEEQAAA